uniref:Dual specificity protein phosphatase n=1 Tax=Oncorhynchus kisutch TaxID=8019 RepID=A0A8C7IFT0_ONCKI
HPTYPREVNDGEDRCSAGESEGHGISVSLLLASEEDSGRAIAQNRGALKKLGITHILNAAHFKQGSIGDQDYYGNTCVYCGFPTEDSSHFDLSQYFKPAADFIHKALKTKDGKVLVHCIMGISRSATLVLAFLMMHCRLPLRTALKHVTQRRAIYPNRHFLSLLLTLDTQLTRKRRLCPLL